jgi:hypothetical protein
LTGDAKERERHTHTHILLLLLLNAVCIPLGASTDKIVTCVNFVIFLPAASISVIKKKTVTQNQSCNILLMQTTWQSHPL